RVQRVVNWACHPAAFSRTLPPEENYDTGVPRVGVIRVQPFVELRGTKRVEIPIGTELKNFLDYPLNSMEKMNLSLPFYDGTLGIENRGGGWFRNGDD